jgi:single-strand DNA-binding protein
MRVLVVGRLEQRTWETADGERRSKVEIVAEEVGPSLRFATAEVHKLERAATVEGQTGTGDDAADPSDRSDPSLADA